MPFEQHQEKNYPKGAQDIYQAALNVTEKLSGRVISSAPQEYRFEARFPKVLAHVHTAGEPGVVVRDSFAAQPDAGVKPGLRMDRRNVLRRVRVGGRRWRPVWRQRDAIDCVRVPVERSNEFGARRLQRRME